MNDGIAVAIQEVIEVVEVGIQGPRGPSGEVPAIYFDYGDATPGILYTPTVDHVIRSVSLSVLVPFDGVGAMVSIGTDADHELLMDEDNSSLVFVATYETSPMETIPDGEPIKVFITPGSGATTGRCMVLIVYALA